MGRGSSKAGGKSVASGGTNTEIMSQAQKNITGVSGYKAVATNGDEMEFYFREVENSKTLYGNNIGLINKETPNGWTEKELIQAIKNNGGSVKEYSKKQLLNFEIERLKDREKTNEFLNKESVRNRGGDMINRAYRNSKKAARIARRG